MKTFVPVGAWQAASIAQRLGVDPRYLRRFRWIRKANAVHRHNASLLGNLRFVLLDPEPDNFTYDVGNLGDLAQWVSSVAGCSLEVAHNLVGEPRTDELLESRLRAATAGHWLWSKAAPPFGKRLGWYAVARLARPRLIVEVGVHDGLGSALLLRALERNLDDGYPGRLVSFDINHSAGWLVGEHPLWQLRIQSSDQGLPDVLDSGNDLGLFVYDGWHAYDAERADVELAAEHLSPTGVLLSDDAYTRALHDVSQAHGLAYFEFHETSVGHFYPGGVLGAGVRGRSAASAEAPNPEDR